MKLLRSLILILLLYFGLSSLYYSSKVKRLDKELSIALNNSRQYESLLDQNKSDNRVLQLTINDFKNSNDSLMNVIANQSKKLAIKDKELKQAMSVSTVLVDTLHQVIPAKEKDFLVELKPNQLTTIKIQRVDSMLTCIPEIYNRQDLFVYSRKEYRNKRKNFFDRLIHFDFKKDKINRYQILNTNDLIQVTDTRIVNISE